MQHELKTKKEQCLELDKGLLKANRELFEAQEENDKLKKELKAGQTRCTNLKRGRKKKGRGLKRNSSECWEADFKEKELEVRILRRGCEEAKVWVLRIGATLELCTYCNRAVDKYGKIRASVSVVLLTSESDSFELYSSSSSWKV